MKRKFVSMFTAFLLLTNLAGCGSDPVSNSSEETAANSNTGDIAVNSNSEGTGVNSDKLIMTGYKYSSEIKFPWNTITYSGDMLVVNESNELLFIPVAIKGNMLTSGQPIKIRDNVVGVLGDDYGFRVLQPNGDLIRCRWISDEPGPGSSMGYTEKKTLENIKYIYDTRLGYTIITEENEFFDMSFGDFVKTQDNAIMGFCYYTFLRPDGKLYYYYRKDVNEEAQWNLVAEDVVFVNRDMAGVMYYITKSGRLYYFNSQSGLSASNGGSTHRGIITPVTSDVKYVDVRHDVAYVVKKDGTLFEASRDSSTGTFSLQYITDDVNCVYDDLASSLMILKNNGDLYAKCHLGKFEEQVIVKICENIKLPDLSYSLPDNTPDSEYKKYIGKYSMTGQIETMVDSCFLEIKSMSENSVELSLPELACYDETVKLNDNQGKIKLEDETLKIMFEEDKIIIEPYSLFGNDENWQYEFLLDDGM